VTETARAAGTGGGRFAGRHIAITGAGTGIGRAIALRLAREGATLSLFGRRLSLLQETAREVEGLGVEAPFLRPLDIRDAKEVDLAFDEAAGAQGALYALVANAGIGGPNEPGDSDRFDDLVATNLGGSYACARAAQRQLGTKSERRHILFVSSILGRIGVAGYTGYCASKAGLLGLTRALAMELAPEEIQVNAVCPGWVDTDMAREGLAGLGEALGVGPEKAHDIAMEDVPLGCMGQPDEVAGLVAYLLSEDGRGITGQGLDMNGGAWMG
jgi:NAD(P)-dependent dehydrogenase (short-subunit alcohol dehydrogenase family)